MNPLEALERFLAQSPIKGIEVLANSETLSLASLIRQLEQSGFGGTATRFQRRVPERAYVEVTEIRIKVECNEVPRSSVSPKHR